MQLIAIWKRKEADVIVYSVHAYLRGGSGDPNIIEGTAPASKLLQIGDTFNLINNPYKYDGYKFIGWLDSKGNLYEPGTKYTVENYNAIFTAEWVLDSTAVVKNSVTYKSGASGVTGNAPNSFKLYNKNSFTIAENTFKYEGYKFKCWNDGTKDYKPGDTYTVTGTGDITLNAVWEMQATVLSVNITSGSGGSVSPNGIISVNQGEKLEVVATPDEGYTIDFFKVNGVETTHSGGKLVIDRVSDDLNIVVEFKKNTHKIRIETDDNGSTDPSDLIEVAPGKDVSIKLTPKTGYKVDKVLVDGADYDYKSGDVVLKEVSASHVVSISFKKLDNNESLIGDTSIHQPKNDKVGAIIAIVIVIIAVLSLVALYAYNESKKKPKRRRK